MIRTSRDQESLYYQNMTFNDEIFLVRTALEWYEKTERYHLVQTQVQVHDSFQSSVLREGLNGLSVIGQPRSGHIVQDFKSVTSSSCIEIITCEGQPDGN